MKTSGNEAMRDGSLTKLTTAFSRDQEHKIYVQHRMIEEGAQLWQWLERGRHLLRLRRQNAHGRRCGRGAARGYQGARRQERRGSGGLRRGDEERASLSSRCLLDRMDQD